MIEDLGDVDVLRMLGMSKKPTVDSVSIPYRNRPLHSSTDNAGYIKKCHSIVQ
jgi:hypothetical protein